MTRVQFLWFDGCPSHGPARALLDEVIAAVAVAHRFPGSPTIRVDGRDIDPNFVDPGDYTPRCRLFRTADGLRGVPPREWIEDALSGGQSRTSR